MCSVLDSVKCALAHCVITKIGYCVQYAELQKAGSMGSAEPNFFQILRQICPVFRPKF